MLILDDSIEVKKLVFLLLEFTVDSLNRLDDRALSVSPPTMFYGQWLDGAKQQWLAGWLAGSRASVGGRRPTASVDWRLIVWLVWLLQIIWIKMASEKFEIILGSTSDDISDGMCIDCRKSARKVFNTLRECDFCKKIKEF